MNRVYLHNDSVPKYSGWYECDAIINYGSVAHTIAAAHGVDIEVMEDLPGEFLVQDVEGDLAKCFYSSCGSFDWDDYGEVVDWFDQNPYLEQEAIVAYLDWTGSWDAARFNDAYCGQWESLQAYVEETYSECYEIPDHLANYIDWEAITRDWSFDYHEQDGHVFRSC